jgi:hypothetical protein
VIFKELFLWGKGKCAAFSTFFHITAAKKRAL